MQEHLLTIVQIIFADIILSADNALVIGMAAAGVPVQYRRWAIFLGLAMAALFRIVFAVIAAYLLQIPGILIVGGLLLCWVCWRFYLDLRENFGSPENMDVPDATQESNVPLTSLRKALVTITVADISMSIDNVLAIAAIAREDVHMLVFGITLAILLMAVGATLIMKILTRFPILGYAGLLFLIYLSGSLLYDGTVDLVEIYRPHWFH